MSDDSFIREVEQELRSDRLNALWKRFGPLIIGGVVLIVLATAGWRAWLAWDESRANASGDRFLAALDRIDEGDEEGALAALRELEEDGYGRYDLLARMRAAALIADSDPRGAIEAFTAVAQDGSTPPAIADVARIRAAYLLVDHGTAGEINALVGPLAQDDEPLRHSAREALGLAAWKAGERETAAERFQAIADDTQAPPGIATRAEEMLALIASLGDGAAPEAGEASVAPEPVAPVAPADTSIPSPTEGTATPLIVTPAPGTEGAAAPVAVPDVVVPLGEAEIPATDDVGAPGEQGAAIEPEGAPDAPETPLTPVAPVEAPAAPADGG